MGFLVCKKRKRFKEERSVDSDRFKTQQEGRSTHPPTGILLFFIPARKIHEADSMWRSRGGISAQRIVFHIHRV